MPQAQDLLEKLADILLYNFHREHILLKLKIKKLLREISIGLKTYQLEFSPVFNNQKVNSSPQAFVLFCFYLYLICFRAFVIDAPRHLSNDLRKRLMRNA